MLGFRFLVVALAAGIMVVGIATLPGMHTDVLPETSSAVVEIQTDAPGLSAPEVESLVTTPLEKNLLEGVMGVTSVTSDSIPGLSAIDLHFAPGTGLYQARQLVQERLTQAFVLPNVSRPPVMRQPVSSTGNVLMVGLTSTRLSQIELSVLARWTIVPRLLGVAGVAEVSTFGQADQQLQVLVTPTVLAAHHISLAQIIATAGNSQLVTPLSYLEGSTPGTGGFLESPNQRITIRHVLPFGTPANLGQVPVTEAGDRQVLLGSVASIVQGHQPLIGDAQVRNLGTVGGSLVHGDPSGDWGPVLLALGGEVHCLGPGGNRLIPASEFFTEMYETARQPDEMVTEVRIASPAGRAGGSYVKLERRAGDFAIVGAAVYLALDEHGACAEAGIALSGVASTYVKATTAERVLRGSRLNEATIAEAARCLDIEMDPYSDARAPAEYKRAMAKVFVQKALEVARQRATAGRA